MSIFKNIKEGWSNYMKAFGDYHGEKISPVVEKIARERAEICKECPELKESGFYKLVDKVVNRIDGTKDKKKVLHRAETPTVADESMWDGRTYKCGQCGCQFPANVYSPGKSCPMGKWEAYELENEKDLNES